MNRKSVFQLSLLLFIAFVLNACQNNERELTIAISKAKPDKWYGNYPQWVHKADSKVKIINMYELGLDSALQVLDYCDGLIISGGADVYPGWYGKLADTANCGAFDRYRDTLEIELIRKAMALKMPLVGICRGQQILNVSLGGSLIIDIPTDHDTVIKHRLVDWENCFHQIQLTKGSLLSKLSSQSEGKVNSNHHQAIDQLADDLKISSIARDGIIESVEWRNPKDKGFMIAVQWHPERLDTVNPELSLPIIREMLFQAEQYHTYK
ncbi:gamma-glutamyl-gamma-aminobutyrate hydrolase family protein [Lentimicrobium sp. S6]|uniref:gamma-glutamyl-gamma-aminobutyrate hydrolase family protein n=1 Tax=Lentimicrobium sp. S6 TaxID=2735872 RepID=UPI001553946E|nr:gamma-glutamyl-gamma-aminobutyrate hydrolase family protein [Lentimicrobium sp. S6]NPD44987.1 C26 family cysteine hydrolase domain-containing family [Lentimicrobium sp. S6]